jgi:predicted metal-binding protein
MNSILSMGYYYAHHIVVGCCRWVDELNVFIFCTMSSLMDNLPPNVISMNYLIMVGLPPHNGNT